MSGHNLLRKKNSQNISCFKIMSKLVFYCNITINTSLDIILKHDIYWKFVFLKRLCLGHHSIINTTLSKKALKQSLFVTVL